MKTKVKMLKVKIKSLAAEAAIIRLEERRATKDAILRCRLREHRVHDVRGEQRASLLAYAFLRGRPLSATEPKAKRTPDWQRVRKIVEKFGTCSYTEVKPQMEAFDAWRTVAVS